MMLGGPIGRSVIDDKLKIPYACAITSLNVNRCDEQPEEETEPASIFDENGCVGPPVQTIISWDYVAMLARLRWAF